MSYCSTKTSSPSTKNTALYNELQTFDFIQNGMYATGISCADLDRNNFMDIVNSNGNDMAPNPLTYYPNWGLSTGIPYPYIPNYTQQIGFNTRLQLGDLNNDGWTDIVMVTVFDKEALHTAAFKQQYDVHYFDIHKPGSLKIFMNNKGSIPNSATYELTMTSFPFDIDLGDVDADGDLDLLVAYLWQKGTNNTPVGARAEIFENRAGKITQNTLWRSKNAYQALSTSFADINQDGLLDVVLGVKAFKRGDNGIHAFLGKTENGHFTIDTLPEWNYAIQSSLSAFSLNIGLLREGGSPPEKEDVFCVVGAQYMANQGVTKQLRTPGVKHLAATQNESEDFYAIRFSDSTCLWKTEAKTLQVREPSFAAIGDVNNDGLADLVSGFFKTADGSLNEGGPFFVFNGSLTPEQQYTFNESFRSKTLGVHQEISLSYAGNCDPTQQTIVREKVFVTKVQQEGTTISIPCNTVMDIVGVTLEGNEVSRAQFSWSTNSNLLTLSKSAGWTTGAALKIRYLTTLRKDIFLSYWNANKGNSIYFSSFQKQP